MSKRTAAQAVADELEAAEARLAKANQRRDALRARAAGLDLEIKAADEAARSWEDQVARIRAAQSALSGTVSVIKASEAEEARP